jgi:hypothetical protein
MADFLPVDMFNSGEGDVYIKVAADDSFSWSQYRLHALIVGSFLLAICKFTNVFK